jgi:hypothetical protein
LRCGAERINVSILGIIQILLQRTLLAIWVGRKERTDDIARWRQSVRKVGHRRGRSYRIPTVPTQPHSPTMHGAPQGISSGICLTFWFLRARHSGQKVLCILCRAAPTLHCALRCWVVADAHLVSMQHLNSFVEFLGLQGYVGRSRVDVQIVV